MFCFVNDYSEGAREHMLQRRLQQKAAVKDTRIPVHPCLMTARFSDAQGKHNQCGQGSREIPCRF